MYKKLLPSLFLLGCAFGSFAQPVLTGANFNPQIADSFAIRNCDTTGVVQGPGGPGQVWNFTGLVATSTDIGTAVSCVSTPHCSMFPGSTLALISPNSNLIQYISADASKLSQVGYYQAIDTNLVLNNPMDQIRYPFTYPDTFTDSYTGTLTFSIATAAEIGTVFVECDGFGTLNLPTISYDSVLRVHSTQDFTDSTNLFGTPTIENFNISTYTWYKPNFHTALLTISFVTQTGAASASYKLVSFVPGTIATLNASQVNTSSSLTLYPNPVQNELNIAYKSGSNESTRITLTDVAGREIAVIADGSAQALQHATYNTSGIAKGLYIIRLQSGTETITRKVVIE